MIDDSLELAKYRLQKAYDHLKSAEILLDASMYNDSLGRSYYTMFNAARALLYEQAGYQHEHGAEYAAFDNSR